MNKYKKIRSIININLVVIFISLILSFIIIRLCSKNFEEIILPLEDTKMRSNITKYINDAVNSIEYKNNLIVIDKDNNNNIKMINYDSVEVTKILNQVTNNIQLNIDSNKNIFEDIPLGIIFNNSFIRNLGPNIKIKMFIDSNVISMIETEVKPYGINNAYLEVRILLEVHGIIYLPLTSHEVVVKNVVPIAMNVINGNVPEGYIIGYN